VKEGGLLKLLLIEVINPLRRQDLGLSTGLGYISAYLRRDLPATDVRIVQEGVEQEIESFRPDVVGISSVSQNFRHAQEVARVAKSHGAFVLVGGHHISALPESLTSHMDLGVIGEGEQTALDVCRLLEQGDTSQEGFLQIPGLVFRDQSGRLVRTAPRQLITPLDRIPFPARDLMHLRRGQAIGMLSSRGCPYHCVFCASSAFWSHARFHSAEYVVAEMRSVIRDYDTEHLFFYDDLFVADRERTRKIADLMEQQGLTRRLELTVTCRANLVDEELVRLLRRLQVRQVMLGLESLSSSTLHYLKGNVTPEHNRRAVTLLASHGFKVIGFFIIGSPREERKDIEQTLEFVRTAPLHRAEAYLLTPLPGTAVWEYAKQRGLVSDDMHWDRLYIDQPENPNGGLILSETLPAQALREYLATFNAIRRRKDRSLRMLKYWSYLKQVITRPRRSFAVAAAAFGAAIVGWRRR
jgi:anaerobic magnesium-protoporphyrin IX monomethyl ester cyclase